MLARSMGTTGVMCAAVLLAVTAALTGCQRNGGSGSSSDGSLDDGGRGGRPTANGSATAGGGAVFLGVGACSSRGQRTFTEVSCGSERAAARVVARHDGKVSEGPLCPARTDFVLHISENRPAVDEDGDGEVPQGYACMRNLEAPHPGDPGGGGGPRTVVGDCVYGVGRGEVRETACSGAGNRKPQYRVRVAVSDRSKCPADTALYVSLGGERPVGCAVRV
ncbi:hypothetical protein [Streptomyces sp. NPDC059009]|uniref:hypothetical protein n=1 Tax=Streptomyces sp. NPDC059009 TaxID=3346694 RepID=UPI00367EA071